MKTTREGHPIADQFDLSHSHLSRRRVPGSGIRNGASIQSDAKRPVQPARNRPASAFSVKLPQISSPDLSKVKLPNVPDAPWLPDVPKQWRHLSVVALALLVAAIGVDQQSIKPAGAQLAQASSISYAHASESVDNLLPSVKSINLPPVPVKNVGAREANIPAAGVIVMDDATKLPLYERSADERRAIASTTKVLTAQVAMEQYKDRLDQPVTLTQEAINQIGSGVGFHVGETATVRQLLYGLLMVSGNDAARQLSEIITPANDDSSTDVFVGKMNQLAQRLGMTNSHYLDPAGLNDQGYSTPADMAKAFSNLLTYPELVKVIGTADYQYTSPQGFQHVFKNSNRLVTSEMYYQGMIGGKTGFTPETPDGGAGHCLIVAAERNGHRLIAAVYGTYSGAPQASAEAARLALDYAFNNYTWQPISR